MQDAESQSITDWLHQLGNGNDHAADRLWKHFSARMSELARKRILDLRTGAFDEEDLALSAFDHFCRAVQDGRYQQVGGRDELWRLLAAITVRKTQQRRTEELRQKRGGNMTLVSDVDWNELPGNEPSPAMIALLTDECRHYLNMLPDDELRAVALWKLEGYTVAEIAEKVGYSRRTTERMLQGIRKAWKHAGGIDD